MIKIRGLQFQFLIGSIGLIILFVILYFVENKIPTNFILPLVGTACNVIAVASNGWRMPAIGSTKKEITHFTIGKRDEIRVYYLCDIIHIFRNVYMSIGDIILIGGLLYYIISIL